MLKYYLQTAALGYLSQADTLHGFMCRCLTRARHRNSWTLLGHSQKHATHIDIMKKLGFAIDNGRILILLKFCCCSHPTHPSPRFKTTSNYKYIEVIE